MNANDIRYRMHMEDLLTDQSAIVEPTDLPLIEVELEVCYAGMLDPLEMLQDDAEEDLFADSCDALKGRMNRRAARAAKAARQTL